MADKRISQLIERTDIANNDVLPIVASGATTTNKVTVSTLQDWMQDNLDVGVTSVGLSVPSAFTVSGSPVTTSGNITISGAGTTAQYIRGDGSLADFPSSLGGGGASVSYYLNGSVSQGTIGGVAYRELSKSPILGAGTDFTINADGYIASFITDAGDPSLLEIPGGNWNFETYFQASSGGGSPTFYVELYKVSVAGTATLIATSSGSPELIAFGTNITPYFSSLAVPTTTLALTDRLAIRYYVVHAGRTITLHTENNTLCQIITTFTTGLTALNGLTAQVQNFATGTSGTDFNISSASTTHTFNIPSASADNRGLVTTGAQTFAGAKTFNSSVTASSLIRTGGTSSQFLKADGSVDSSTYLTTGTAASVYVPYTGATTSVNLGTNTLSSSNLIANGGFNSGKLLLKNSNAASLIDTGYFTLSPSSNTTTIHFGFSTGASTWKNFGFSSHLIPDNTITLFSLPSGGGTLAVTSDLGAYLPLTGGTLTGALGGTSLNFSGDIQTATRLISATGGQQILINANNGGSTNRIESVGTLPLALVSAAAITMAAGGTTPQITLTTAGNVAIGTGSVTGAINADSFRSNLILGAANSNKISFNNGSTTETGFIYNDSSETSIGYPSSGSFAVQRVGVGSVFTIASTGAATFSSSVTANGLYANAGNSARFYRSANDYYWGINNDSNNYLNFGTFAANGTAYGTNPKLILLDNGNVGIGTASPQSRLHVVNTSNTLLQLNGNNTTAALDTGFTISADDSKNIYLYQRENAASIFATNNTERMRITSDGYARLSASSGGIQFNGDTAAANALDDYEEGTWTMGISFGGASVGVTYSSNTGTYTKIGREVTVNGIIVLTNKGTSTGVARVTGLPFVPNNSLSFYSSIAIRVSNVSSNGFIQGYVEVGLNTIRIESINLLGSRSDLFDNNFINTSDVMISFSYFV